MSGFELLQWDSNFFGVKVAKVDPQIKEEEYQGILARMSQEKVELAYWNSEFSLPFSRYYEVLKLDTSVRLSKNLEQIKDYHPNIKFFNELEPTLELLDLSRRVARRSRFYLDPNISNQKVYDLYEIWLRKSLKGKAADEVLIYEENTEILGFATIKINEQGEGVIPLLSVHADHEGRGISFLLMQAIESYLLQNGCKILISNTQAKNIKALAIYKRFNIQCQESFNINHLWLKKQVT